MSDRQIKLDGDVSRALDGLADKRIDHVFFVACGGSLAVMYPAKYLLDRHSAALSSDCYNADEFVHRDPRALGANSLVILCSMTGTTKETLRAAEHARARGAVTIGLSVDAGSPLSEMVDFAVRFEAPYTTGVPIDAIDSNYSRLYQIVMGLVKRYDGIDKLARFWQAWAIFRPRSIALTSVMRKCSTTSLTASRTRMLSTPSRAVRHTVRHIPSRSAC